MAGHHPSRLSVARNAQILLHHSRRNPALTCRAGANSLPVSLQVRSSLPVARGQVAQGVQHVAEHAVRVVTDAAWQAEQAARLAEAVGRGARRGNLVAMSLGALAVLLGIAVVAAGRITMRTDAEMASVAAALRQLNATQRQINDRLTAQQASQAALAGPTSQGSILPVAPAATAPVMVPVAPLGPAVPVPIKPLPPLTWSTPNEPMRRLQADDWPARRPRLNREAPSNVATSEAAPGTAG